MSQKIIREIKIKLKSMYKDYRFDITCSQDELTYTITVYKDRNNLGSYTVQSNTPMDQFLNSFMIWMKESIIGKR